MSVLSAPVVTLHKRPRSGAGLGYASGSGQEISSILSIAYGYSFPRQPFASYGSYLRVIQGYMGNLFILPQVPHYISGF